MNICILIFSYRYLHQCTDSENGKVACPRLEPPASRSSPTLRAEWPGCLSSKSLKCLMMPFELF